MGQQNVIAAVYDIYIYHYMYIVMIILYYRGPIW